MRRRFATVKGVISIIVDFAKKRCTIRAKLSLRVEVCAFGSERGHIVSLLSNELSECG